MDIFGKNKSETLKNAGGKVLFVVGIMAALSLVTWGAVQIPHMAPEAYKNLAAVVTNLTARFFPIGEDEGALLFTMPTRNAISDEPFVFSWVAAETGESSYTFTYACDDGFIFKIPGNFENEVIACDTPFAFTNTTGTLTLIPSSVNNRFLDIFITVASADGNTRGSALITVINQTVADSRSFLEQEIGIGSSDTAIEVIAPSFPAETETRIIGDETPFISDPNGKPDLIGYILAVGTIDADTDEFIATSSVDRSGVAAVRFEVRNIGTKDTGPWTFEATLPTTSTYTFRPSGVQQSLSPGERVEYTLSFDRLRRSSTGRVLINIDPKDELDEFTRDNNQIETTLSIIQ